jgi:NAD(P)-dependent dehydrogenase (short-subunit alcohol dehydrogenase family)
LINNAGTLISKPFEKLSVEDFEQVFSVNVFSCAMLIQKLLPILGSGSHVVSISSMGGVQGSVKFPGLAAYSSSKGALQVLTEVLAEEYKARDISFNCLALGAVQTEMLEEAFPGFKAPVQADQMARYIFDFAVQGAALFNGKTLPVAVTTP